MQRTHRTQAAIVQDRHILLIQHQEHASGRSYWLLPGGGKEPGETEEECVRREVWEETGLKVQVERLVMEAPESWGNVQRRTYLCTLLSGEATPGYEPEPEVSSIYKIASVRWVDLSNRDSWGEAVIADQLTYPELLKLRTILALGTEQV